MNSLPDEILEEIINYAMMRDDPFCIQEYFHCHTLTTNRDMQRVHHSQRPHLLDWGLVVGTCKRFRRLGKEAFFSQKVFVMDAQYLGRLRNLEPDFLTTQDQYLATRYIRSIILIEGIFLNVQDHHKWHKFYPFSGFNDSVIASPTSFLYLSSRILSFPRLERLDFLFGYREAEGVLLIVQAAQARWRAWSLFTNYLGLIGVPTGRLDIGMMTCEGLTGDDLAAGLRWTIYTVLKAIVRTKTKRIGDAS